jgi:hypothetical protein
MATITQKNQWRIWPLYFTCIGFACLLLFKLLGSYVDSQGIIHEAFFLIPIGFIFIVVGLMVLLFRLIRRCAKRGLIFVLSAKRKK